MRTCSRWQRMCSSSGLSRLRLREGSASKSRLRGQSDKAFIVLKRPGIALVPEETRCDRLSDNPGRTIHYRYCSRRLFNARSHKTSGLHSPCFARSTISFCDEFVSLIKPVGKSEGYASHFECDAHDARSLAIKLHAVQK